MRTRNSDTFLTGKDYYKTVAYQDSINYGARGGWRPIDNSLVSSSTSGYAYENKANRYRVLFPSSLSAPVRVELGGSWVQFALVGGGGSASSSGATATYTLATTQSTMWIRRDWQSAVRAASSRYGRYAAIAPA
jgi:hypothetical protein